MGTTNKGEASQLVSREVYVSDGYQLQFVVNIGCGEAQNRTLPPVNLQYSTDHGITWSHFYPACQEAGGQCLQYPSMPSVLYGHAWPVWERVVIPLYGLPTSKYVCVMVIPLYGLPTSVCVCYGHPSVWTAHLCVCYGHPSVWTAHL